MALACVGAALVFVLVQARAARPFGVFSGACQRIQEAGLQLSSKDWFCFTPRYWRLSFGLAALVLALACVLPSAILASTGRRWTALVPPAIGVIFWPMGNLLGLPLLVGGLTTKLLCLAALAAPVAAIALVSGGKRAGSRRPRWQPAVVSALACGLASLAIILITNRLAARHFGPPGFSWAPWPPLAGIAVPIAVFGLLLGPDRRWWPWSLGFVALLASAGPGAALLPNHDRALAWSIFGSAVPLAAIALVWSMWRPMATWLNAKVERAEGRESQATAASTDPIAEPIRRRLCPVAVLDAFALGLLAVSIVVFQGDPLPATQATVFPTYLGLRAQAADARAKMDLRMAVATLDSYAAAYGNYSGFDAAQATAIDPSLAWRDGTDPSGGWAVFPSLTMAIVPDSSKRVRIVAVSEGGAAFCMQRTPRAITFGGSGQPGDTRSRSALVNRAIANCDAKPWSASAWRVTDTSNMCEGLDPFGGYVTCRMVQAFVAKTLLEIKPPGS